jgi:chromosome partitioning protein
LPFDGVDERKAMQAVHTRDFVVIDTPARPDSADLKELSSGCDLMILPTTPDVVSLEPMLATARALGNANYRALLTIVPPHPNRDGELMRTDLQASGIPVFQTMIRRATAFQKVALLGIPIRDAADRRDRRGWLDYQAVGQEIMGILKHG